MSLMHFKGYSKKHRNDLDFGDDVINQNRPLGKSTIDKRFAKVPWLWPMLDRDWHGLTNSPYIAGWAAMARVMISAAALRTSNSVDLSYATGVSETFILAVLFALKYWGWESTALPEMTSAIRKAPGDEEPTIIGDIAVEFLLSVEDHRMDFLDVLKAMGLAV